MAFLLEFLWLIVTGCTVWLPSGQGFTYGCGWNSSSDEPTKLTNIRLQSFGTNRRLRRSLLIMFILLNPRSASAEETGIILIAVSSSASRAVTRTPPSSMKSRKPFWALSKLTLNRAHNSRSFCSPSIHGLEMSSGHLVGSNICSWKYYKLNIGTSDI